MEDGRQEVVDGEVEGQEVCSPQRPAASPPATQTELPGLVRSRPARCSPPPPPPPRPPRPPPLPDSRPRQERPGPGPVLVAGRGEEGPGHCGQYLYSSLNHRHWLSCYHCSRSHSTLPESQRARPFSYLAAAAAAASPSREVPASSVLQLQELQVVQEVPEVLPYLVGSRGQGNLMGLRLVQASAQPPYPGPASCICPCEGLASDRASGLT